MSGRRPSARGALTDRDPRSSQLPPPLASSRAWSLFSGSFGVNGPLIARVTRTTVIYGLGARSLLGPLISPGPRKKTR